MTEKDNQRRSESDSGIIHHTTEGDKERFFCCAKIKYTSSKDINDKIDKFTDDFIEDVKKNCAESEMKIEERRAFCAGISYAADQIKQIVKDELGFEKVSLVKFE